MIGQICKKGEWGETHAQKGELEVDIDFGMLYGRFDLNIRQI